MLGLVARAYTVGSLPIELGCALILRTVPFGIRRALKITLAIAWGNFRSIQSAEPYGAKSECCAVITGAL